MVRARVECRGPTGVEMEALTAAAVGLLTIYDMVKAVDRGMTLGEPRGWRRNTEANQGYSAARVARIRTPRGDAMNRLRRTLLGALAALLAKPLAALAAWNEDAFGAKTPPTR